MTPAPPTQGSTALHALFKEADREVTEAMATLNRAGVAVRGDTRKSAGHVIVDTLTAHAVQRAHVVPGES